MQKYWSYPWHLGDAWGYVGLLLMTGSPATGVTFGYAGLPEAGSYPAGAKADEGEQEFKATGASWGTLWLPGATRGCRWRREILELIATAITSGFLGLPRAT